MAASSSSSTNESLHPERLGHDSFEVEYNEPPDSSAVSANCFSISMPATTSSTIPNKALMVGMQSSAAAHEGTAGKSKRPEHITIAVLALLVVGLLVGCVLLGIKSSANSSRAASLKEEADKQANVAASLMLTSARLRSGGAGSEPADTRALARAAHLAHSIGQPDLVVAPLSDTINTLARSSFWPFDVRTLTGSGVPDVAFSPDGRLLATASEDTILLTPVKPASSTSSDSLLLPASAQPAAVKCSGGRGVYSVAWSPSGEFLAAGCGTQVQEGKEGQGATATVWRVTGSFEGEASPAFQLLREMEHTHHIKALAWSPDSTALAAADDDAKAKVWLVQEALASNAEVEFVDIDHPRGNDIRTAAWHPSGRMLAFGRTDTKVYLWDLGADRRSPILLAVGTEHSDDVNALAFSPEDGNVLASAGDDDAVMLWDMSPFRDLDFTAFNASDLPLELTAHDSLGDFGGSVTGIAWGSPVTLAASANDGTVRVYEVKAEGLRLEEELWLPNAHFTSVSFTGDEPPRLAAGTSSPRAMVWQQSASLGQSGPEFFTLECSSRVQEVFGKPEFSPRGWAWSADGLRFAMSSYQGYVCIFDRPDADEPVWRTEAVLQIDGAGDRNVPCRHLAFSDLGEALAGGTDRNGVHVWRRAVGGGVPSWDIAAEYNHEDDVNELAWSADGQLLASSSDDSSVAVLSMAHIDSKPTFLNGHVDHVEAVSWHGADSRGEMVLASGSADTTVRVWYISCCASNGQLDLRGMKELHGHSGPVEHLQWSSQGMLASSGHGGEVLIHANALKEEGEAELRHRLDSSSGSVDDLSWSPDGQQLAAAVGDATVRVWSESSSGRWQYWTIQEKCSKIRWIASSPERLSCTRDRQRPSDPEPQEDSPPYDFFIQYLLVRFPDMLALIDRLAYGQLDKADLASLGYQNIDHAALQSP